MPACPSLPEGTFLQISVALLALDWIQPLLRTTIRVTLVTLGIVFWQLNVSNISLISWTSHFL